MDDADEEARMMSALEEPDINIDNSDINGGGDQLQVLAAADMRHIVERSLQELEPDKRPAVRMMFGELMQPLDFEKFSERTIHEWNDCVTLMKDYWRTSDELDLQGVAALACTRYDEAGNVLNQNKVYTGMLITLFEYCKNAGLTSVGNTSQDFVVLQNRVYFAFQSCLMLGRAMASQYSVTLHSGDFPGHCSQYSTILSEYIFDEENLDDEGKPKPVDKMVGLTTFMLNHLHKHNCVVYRGGLAQYVTVTVGSGNIRVPAVAVYDGNKKRARYNPSAPTALYRMINDTISSRNNLKLFKHILGGNGDNILTVEKKLISVNDFRFPTVDSEVDPCTFAYANGIAYYDATPRPGCATAYHNVHFVRYSDFARFEPQKLAHVHIADALIPDALFDNDYTDLRRYTQDTDNGGCDDPLRRLCEDFPAPAFDEFMSVQKFPPAVMFIFLAMLGRIVGGFPLNEVDCWQVILIIYGAQGTGKSTLSDLVKSFYNMCDVAVITPNAERQFGLKVLLGALFWCIEETSKHMNGLNSSDFKCIVSGNWLTVAVKFKDPVVLQFDRPGLITGNNVMHIDDQGGSRRQMVFNFSNTPTPEQCNGNMLAKMLEERANIQMRCVMAYLVHVHMYGKHNIQSKIPQEMKDYRDRVRAENSPLFGFIMFSGIIQLGPGLTMTADMFRSAFEEYAKSINKKDRWSVVHGMQILREFGVVYEEIKTNYVTRGMLVGCNLTSAVAQSPTPAPLTPTPAPVPAPTTTAATSNIGTFLSHLSPA